MKAETTKSEFRPVQIKLTIETEEELDAFASVLNYCPVADGFRHIGVETDGLREAVTKAGGDDSKYFEVGKKFIDEATRYLSK